MIILEKNEVRKLQWKKDLVVLLKKQMDLTLRVKMFEVRTEDIDLR